MIHPGVDIVFLPEALRTPRLSNKRFLEYCFHPHEIDFIRGSRNPEIFIHTLWAVKEAAYKSVMENHKSDPRFSPKSVVVNSLESDGNAAVSLFSSNRKVGYSDTDHYVIAQVNADAKLEIFSVENYTKTEVREKFNNLARQRSEESGRELLCSYSHDGNFAAMSWK